MRKAVVLTFCVLLALSCADGNKGLEKGLREDLARLDKALGNSEQLTLLRQQQIAGISEELLSGNLSLTERYSHFGQLYRLCEAFRFDNAAEAVDGRMMTAEALGDRDLIAEVALDKATLLTSSGMFLEATGVLEEYIDTSRLNTNLKVKYCYLMQRFCQDYSEFIPKAETQELFKARAGYYRGQVLDNAPKGSWSRRHTLVMDHINNGNYLEARDSCLAMMKTIAPESREYAICSYYAAVACQNAGLEDEALHWYIESAICDASNSVKDNASLCCVAVELFERDEVDRAFRYIQLSLEDAHFFNSKVRPWQIARSLPAIEKAYNDTQARHSSFAWKTAVVTSILTSLLLIVLLVLISQYGRNKRYAREMASLNARLEATLSELSEANEVKEEYIGLFLSMCSNYLGKLKKIYSMEQMDAELKNFYTTFDNAFLQLYPDFVRQFNELLKPECRIEIKKGELLNTELRIFALIKLGITQSSHIASLLRYSVNTIYNYRAQIKNAALNSRENFEDAVRKLNGRSTF